MDRDIGSDAREPESRGQDLRANGQPRREEPEKPNNQTHGRAIERPTREYRLSDRQCEAMTEIGRFRTLLVKDLEQYLSQGDSTKMRQECRALLAQRLIQTRSLWLGRDKERLTLVTLTRNGKRLLERSGKPGTFYAGFVKPAEMAHDAAIYRMYQAEASRIAEKGGQVRRITLDYELKRTVYSPLAKERPGSLEYKRRQAEIAAEHGLQVVRGHIQLPDLRIEYQTRDGEMARTDLELATTHYRGGQLAGKAAAGFKFYASSEDAGRLSAVFDDHHITAEILSL